MNAPNVTTLEVRPDMPATSAELEPNMTGFVVAQHMGGLAIAPEPTNNQTIGSLDRMRLRFETVEHQDLIGVGNRVFGRRIATASEAVKNAINPQERAIAENELTNATWDTRAVFTGFTNSPDRVHLDNYLQGFANTEDGLMTRQLAKQYKKWTKDTMSQQQDILDWLASGATDEDIQGFSSWYHNKFTEEFSKPHIVKTVAKKRNAWVDIVMEEKAAGEYSAELDEQEVRNTRVEITDPLSIAAVTGDLTLHADASGFVMPEQKHHTKPVYVAGALRAKRDIRHGHTLYLPASSVKGLLANNDFALFHEGNHTLGRFGVSWLDEAITEHRALIQKGGEPMKIHPADRQDSGTYAGYRALTAVTAFLYDIPPTLLSKAKTDMFVTGDNTVALLTHLERKGEPEALEMITLALDQYIETEAEKRPGESRFLIQDEAAKKLSKDLLDETRRKNTLSWARTQLRHIRKNDPGRTPCLK